ncbi:glycosyltransferase, partial [Escherichia coli]|nr:glycosyltransferase [Escherichia coli]
AIVHPGWPSPAAWPGLIAAGLALDPAFIGGLHDPDAVRTCAATIDDLVRRL